MPRQYIEVVTEDVDATCTAMESALGVTFADKDQALGFARTATRSDGSMIGVRSPLAEHEEPVTRAYHEVVDIEAAAAAAESAGAVIAYPPTAQPPHGSFAIFILGGVQHGLWQPSSS